MKDLVSQEKTIVVNKDSVMFSGRRLVMMILNLVKFERIENDN